MLDEAGHRLGVGVVIHPANEANLVGIVIALPRLEIIEIDAVGKPIGVFVMARFRMSSSSRRLVSVFLCQ